MQLLKQNKHFRRRNLRWLIPTAALLLLASCATEINVPVEVADFPWCTPLPDELGASCDNFLSSSPALLNEVQWEALQAQWFAADGVLECTNSTAVANLKVAIQNLCSEVPCDQATEARFIQALDKIAHLGARHE